jgi:hypothetical protein
MSTRSPTFDELKAPIDLPTGEHHRIVLPPRPVRARLVGILFETDKIFVLPSTGHRGQADRADMTFDCRTSSVAMC